jgi:hypothetical protein
MTTTHRISTTAVLVLSLAAAGAPTALAKHVEDPATAANPPATVYSPQDKSIGPATSPSTTAGNTAKVSAASPVVRVQAPANGFDWGDAGIAAAGGVALLIIGLGGALAVSQHRTRRTRHNPA